MNVKADSCFNEDVLSSGISSMSDDSPSIENGTFAGNRQNGARDDNEQWRHNDEVKLHNFKQSIHDLSGRPVNDGQNIADSEAWRNHHAYQKKPFATGQNQVDLNFKLTDHNMSLQSKPIIGMMGGNFTAGAQIYTPFGDAGKAYFLDSDLETIEEESSVWESDIDEPSPSGNGRQLSGDNARSYKSQRNRTSSASSYLSLSQRGSVTSTITVSDCEKSPSTLSSTSPHRSTSSPSRSNASTPNHEQSDDSGWPEISYKLHGRTQVNENSKLSKIGAIDPNFHQKIVYAKCLSPHEERRQVHSVSAARPVEYQLPLSNGHHGAEQNGYARRNSLENKMPKDELTISDMFEAVRCGDMKTLNKFSPTEQSETVDEGGNTILHAAATAGQLQCVQYLVRGSCKEAVSLPNDDLMTPTALSVQKGQLSCVQWLVGNTTAKEELIVSSRQASIDGSNMRPPLAHVAARHNQDSVLDWLCEQMAKENLPIDSADHYSNAAVHEAAARGHLKCLQTLVGRGASVSILNSYGQTPGQVADKNGHGLCVGYLVVVETCMSLAQQLITVKSENEGIRKENNALRAQVQELHNEKLAQAKESVEERIKATLQSLSSYDEDNESHSSIRQQQLHDSASKMETGVNVADSRNPLQNGSSKPGKSESLEKSKVQIPKKEVTKSTNQNLKLASRFAALPGKSSGDTSRAKQETDMVASKSAKIVDDRADAWKNVDDVVNTEEDIHAEVQDLTHGMEPPKGEQKSILNSTSPVSSGQHQGAKVWEKMAMDEVLRLARDSRYLPSPTMSMCTEDSTMETREVMRDRLAEASRWFLVQQTGGKPRIKDPMLPAHRSRVFTASSRMQQTSMGNTSTWVLGGQKSKYEMRAVSNPPQLTSVPQSLIAATNKHYQLLQEQTGTEKLQAKDNSTMKSFAASSVTSHSSSKLSEQSDNMRSARPRSAKSTSSNMSASTIRQSDSSSSAVSNSTSLFHADSNLYRGAKIGGVAYLGNDPLQKRPADSGSPSSVHSRGSSRPNSAKRSLASTDVPAATMTGMLGDFPSQRSDMAEVRVALPSRNNSFLRKVQTSAELSLTDTTISYPAIPTKSSPKRATNSPSSLRLQSMGKSENSLGAYSPVEQENESALADRQNVISSVSTKKETVTNGTGYAMWKPSPKGFKSVQTPVTVASSAVSSSEKTKKSKSSSRYSHPAMFSVNSPKLSSKKKAPKLFHF